MIKRLSGGSQSARAEAAKKTVEKMKSSGMYVKKPFMPKKRSFRFPQVEAIGQTVVTVEDLTHGYGDKQLFDQQDLSIEKGERVAVIGPNGKHLREGPLRSSQCMRLDNHGAQRF